MTEKTYETGLGCIHYWVSKMVPGRQTLVMLPGLTADHHLFDKQIAFFESRFNLLTWDAPGHAASRPFTLSFTLFDKTRWLHEILEREGILHPVLIGQSMGGYVSQCFMELYPGEAAGFISIDSAPLKRCYVTAAELWLLKRTEPMFLIFPWKLLKKLGTDGCAESGYGKALMRHFVDSYSHKEYCKLADHGYRMLAEAMEADLPYDITCPALLICGKKDQAASTRRYNRMWTKKEDLPLIWIEGAGHNSNTDKPKQVNRLILNFVRSIPDNDPVSDNDSIPDNDPVSENGPLQDNSSAS